MGGESGEVYAAWEHSSDGRDIAGVGDEFRLVIDNVDSRDVLTLQVEADPALEAAAITKTIHQAMTTAWGINFDIECLGPDTLPRTEGKARRWQDNRPKED